MRIAGRSVGFKCSDCDSVRSSFYENESIQGSVKAVFLPSLAQKVVQQFSRTVETAVTKTFMRESRGIP